MSEGLYDLSGLPDFIKSSPGYSKAFHGGSRVSCDPPVLDTDSDYFVYMEGPIKMGHHSEWPDSLAMHDQGFVKGGSMEAEGELFQSYKNSLNVNILVTRSLWWYEKSLLATKVCKYFNLLKKEDRVKMFQAIRDDKEP